MSIGPPLRALPFPRLLVPLSQAPVLLAVLLALLLLPTAAQAQGTRILREPTVSQEHVVFVHANDLWRVSREGGEAVRLTTHVRGEQVRQTPAAVIAGGDPQLERAVEEALRLLETQGVELRPEPAPPVRWRRPDPRR